MKRFLCLFLCLATLFCFVACGNKTDPEALVDTKPQDDFNYPEIVQKFTQESLNLIPIKESDMTTEELRDLVVDFMRYSKTVRYTPNTTYRYEITPIYPDEMIQGEIYGGLPFMNTGSGNIYRLLDQMDPATGVYDMTQFMKNKDLFSNTCPSACYWAWGRVISSVGYARIAQMTHANGYLRVGPYTYNDAIEEFSEQFNTADICTQNGLFKMADSYAALQGADGLVTAGKDVHMMMVTEKPHIVYFEGTDQVDPYNSTVIYIDQNYVWNEVNDGGNTYKMKNNFEATYTFAQLYDKGYLPFTFAELTGEKKVEETIVSTTLTGDTVTADDLFASKVTCNFGISDIYITLKNKNGNDVYRHTVRAAQAGVKELTVARAGDNVFIQGDLEKLSGDYSMEIIVQLSTGERPSVYSGTIKFG